MSNQLQITGDLKVKSLTGALTATAGVVSSVPLGTANGVATLGVDGKVPAAQLPTMGSSYKGTWNASTNTPTIADGVGTAGDYYLVSVGGTWNGIVFLAGNTVIYSGTVWQKAGGGSGTVTSVGLAAPAAFSVSGSPVTSTGTLTLAGAGTSGQYVRGDGTLATFPSLTGYVPYTGATANVNLGFNGLAASNLDIDGYSYSDGGSLSFKQFSSLSLKGNGYTSIGARSNNIFTFFYSQEGSNIKSFSFDVSSLTTNFYRTYFMPNANGTLALTSDLGAYLPLTGGTLSGQLSILRGSGTGLDVASDKVIFRSNTGVGTPRQVEISMGGGTPTFLDAKGYGANYLTDFGIRTYNSSGTAFNVFYGTSAGNVGIGTSSPLSTLQVVPASLSSTIVRFGEASGTTGKQLLFGIDSTTGGSEIQSVWQGTANTTLALNPEGGNVGIGTTSITDKLTVDGAVKAYGTSSGLFMSNRNSVGDSFGFFTQGTLNVYSTVSGVIGTFNATNGTYVPSSDVNRKKDFESSEIGLKEVLQLKPTLYRMKDDDESMAKELGFIAQEVKEFIPQAFVESGDFIGLNFNAIVAALTKAIQEQQTQLEELKELIKNK